MLLLLLSCCCSQLVVESVLLLSLCLLCACACVCFHSFVCHCCLPIEVRLCLPGENASRRQRCSVLFIFYCTTNLHALNCSNTCSLSLSFSLSLQLQPPGSVSLLDGNELAATTTTQRGSHNVPPPTTHRTTAEQQQKQQAAVVASSSPVSASPSASPITPSLIIRKDIHIFNFSDIEVSERPTATLLTELARRSRNGELLHDLSQRAVTATPQPPTTELDDIFISVKTTKNYHDTRLALIIKTWFQLARDQVSA